MFASKAVKAYGDQEKLEKQQKALQEENEKLKEQIHPGCGDHGFALRREEAGPQSKHGG